MNIQEKLKRQVDDIYEKLETMTYDSISDFMDDILDFNFTINSNYEMIGFQLAYALGGPNIYITDEYIEAYWGDEKWMRRYYNNFLWDYMEELYNSNRC